MNKRLSKRILVPAIAGLLTIVPTAPAQVFTWDNHGGGNVWTNQHNWVGDQAPSSGGDTALIAQGGGSTLHLTNGNPGSINIGTIILGNSAYSALRANASAATINIGTTSAVSYLDAGAIPTEFEFGDRGSLFGASSPVVAVNLPGALQVRVRDFRTLNLNARIDGSGSITFSRLSGSDVAFVGIGDGYGFDDSAFPSTFTGGATINSNVNVTVYQPTAQNGSGTITSGPLGTGVVWLAGGTLTLSGLQTDVLLKNTVALTTDSTLATADGDATLGFQGAMLLSSFGGGA